jgi:hypothetical protein
MQLIALGVDKSLHAISKICDLMNEGKVEMEHISKEKMRSRAE